VCGQFYDDDDDDDRPVRFLADRTVGIIMSSVRPSVCLSATVCIVDLGVGVQGKKLYQCVTYY